MVRKIIMHRVKTKEIYIPVVISASVKIVINKTNAHVLPT